MISPSGTFAAEGVETNRVGTYRTRAEQWQQRDAAAQRFAEAQQRASTAGANSPVAATCSDPDGFEALDQRLEELGESIERLARTRFEREAAQRRLEAAEAAERKRKALLIKVLIAAALLVIAIIIVMVML